MRTIDKRDAKRLLRKVVKGKEDYIYEPPRNGYVCEYAYKGEPSCVAGHVFYALGVPVSALNGFDRRNFASVMDIFESGSLEKYGIKLTAGAAEVLQRAQSTQDYVSWVDDKKNYTWGKALEAAEKV